MSDRSNLERIRDELKEFVRLERTLAAVLAFTPVFLIAFDGWEIRDSISAYYDMDENQWFYFLLTVGAMLFIVNGVIKEQHSYNTTLGIFLAGVILFNQDDWTAIHNVFAFLFFGGNATVIFFSKTLGWVKAVFGAVIVVALGLFFFADWFTLFGLEWVSLGIVAVHYILNTAPRVPYVAPQRAG